MQLPPQPTPSGIEGHPHCTCLRLHTPRVGVHVAHTVRNALSKEGAVGAEWKDPEVFKKGGHLESPSTEPWEGRTPPTYPEEVGGDSEWIKCLIPTARPSLSS